MQDPDLLENLRKERAALVVMLKINQARADSARLRIEQIDAELRK